MADDREGEDTPCLDGFPLNFSYKVYQFLISHLGNQIVISLINGNSLQDCLCWNPTLHFEFKLHNVCRSWATRQDSQYIKAVIVMLLL